MNNELTVGEVAKALGVSHDTVTRWVKTGKLKGRKFGIFPGKTSKILIPRSELTRVEKLIEQRSSLAKA